MNKSTPGSFKKGNKPWNIGVKWTRRPIGYWSMKHKCCVKCGTTKIPHNANGLCKSCYYKTDEQHLTQKKYREKLKLTVMTHYCNGTPRCMCCGEKEIKFLVIDHINGCGTKRRKVEPSGSPIHIFLKARKFPEGYQVLCHNCNAAKESYGICPHQQ